MTTATPSTTTRASEGIRLADATTMDAVTLRVADLEGMSAYYEGAFAFTPLEERTRGREVHRVLGRGDTPMLRLIHTPDLPEAGRKEAGLYHTAFLFDSPQSLSATVYRASREPRSRFVGASDHLVSEAFYFTDPEGNGVELYRDRDRSTWHRDRNGEIVMDTVRLDAHRYLGQHLTESALETVSAQAGRVGHVHLQVGGLAQAREFYVGALGFDVTTSTYPGALFASAGGYHHHIAMNIWRSQGAGPRAASLGLGEVAITVPDRAELDALIERLRDRGLAYEDRGRSVSVRDPWGTLVTLSLPEVSADELLVR